MNLYGFDAQGERKSRQAIQALCQLDQLGPEVAELTKRNPVELFELNNHKLIEDSKLKSFEYMTQAAVFSDYFLANFESVEEVLEISRHTRLFLEQALDEDANCIDARRMHNRLKLGPLGSEGHFRFLLEHKSEVFDQCQAEWEEKLALLNPLACQALSTLARKFFIVHDLSGAEDETVAREFIKSIVFLPYIRWMASLASYALLCGHYHLCIDTCDELFAFDPHDHANAHFTKSFAHVMLEDKAGLDELCKRWANKGDWAGYNCWICLAWAALEFRLGHEDVAASYIQSILSNYPFAAYALGQQNELPEALFARQVLIPNSHEELIVCISEAVKLLMEGAGLQERGPFGSWLKNLPEVSDRFEDDYQALMEQAERGVEAEMGMFFSPESDGSVDKPENPDASLK